LKLLKQNVAAYGLAVVQVSIEFEAASQTGRAAFGERAPRPRRVGLIALCRLSRPAPLSLAARVGVVHLASKTLARRLADVETIPQQDSAEHAFDKLMRTFTAQGAALKDCRAKGEQKMTGATRPCCGGRIGRRRERQRGFGAGRGAREKPENNPARLAMRRAKRCRATSKLFHRCRSPNWPPRPLLTRRS